MANVNATENSPADLEDLLDNAVPAITPRSTRKSPERQLAHKAKMAGKKLDHARRIASGAYLARPQFRSINEVRRYYNRGSIARINRHTGKPHEHKQEIARRADQALIKAGTHPWRGQNPKVAA